MKKEFFDCYYQVFDEDGKIKTCGRDKCAKLIEVAEKICPEATPGTFGSNITGWMNVKALQELKNKLS